MRAFALVLILPLLASPAMAAQTTTGAQAQSVALHFMPHPGDKLRQTIGLNMQIDMNMLPGPDMSEEQRSQLLEKARKMGKGMTMDMKMSLRTEASEADAKGDYLLHLRGEGGEMNLHMPGQPVKAMPHLMGDIELDALTNTARPEFDILRVKGGMAALQDPKALDGMARGVIKQAFGAMSELEGRSMKVGESAEIPFDMQMPITQMPGQTHVNTSVVYTLKSIHQGIATFDTAIKISLGIAASDGDSKKINATTTGSGTGHLAYRIADRLPLRHDMDATMHTHMQLPGGADMQMDMKMQMIERAERYR